MNSSFHYYTIHFLAVKAGFSKPEASTLSYSSQYVDSNLRPWRIETPQGPYDTLPTQNYAFWNPEVVRQIYLPFHFIPSGSEVFPSVRKDGRTQPYDVRPNSDMAKSLLKAALKTRNLYRVGIALHGFADTWAHQNFTGLPEYWNQLERTTPLPPAGHAQAASAPDQWTQVWEDHRLQEPRIRNSDRFLGCAGKIYRYLCIYQGKDFKLDEDFVRWELEEIVQATSQARSDEERTLDFILWGDLEPYDKNRWIREAAEPPSDTEEGPVIWEELMKLKEELFSKVGLGHRETIQGRPQWETSAFKQWMDAARDHLTEAHRLFDQRFPRWNLLGKG